MFDKTRIEVLSLLSHLVLAVLLVASYVILRLHGIDDEAIKWALISGITFFFGSSATGIVSLKSKQADSQNVPKNEPPKNGGTGGMGI